MTDPTNTRYFVDLDGHDEPTIWIGTGPDDPNCQPIVRKCTLDGEHPVLWPTVVQALTEQVDPNPEWLADGDLFGTGAEAGDSLRRAWRDRFEVGQAVEAKYVGDDWRAGTVEVADADKNHFKVWVPSIKSHYRGPSEFLRPASSVRDTAETVARRIVVDTESRQG